MAFIVASEQLSKNENLYKLEKIHKINKKIFLKELLEFALTARLKNPQYFSPKYLTRLNYIYKNFSQYIKSLKLRIIVKEKLFFSFKIALFHKHNFLQVIESRS